MDRHKVTVPEIKNRKNQEPIVMVTAYDFPGGVTTDLAEVDIVLVGDSLGMTVLGRDSTLSVTVEEMVHHVKAVKNSGTRSLIVADMPWMSYHLGTNRAKKNASKIIKAGAEAVKVEGGVERKDVVEALCDTEIPVMGHIGLTPQSINVFGGFKVQGKSEQQKNKLLEDAKALEDAGCFAIVLECIPESLAQEITQNISIPSIGIGAGKFCDGQVLVFHDILGLRPGNKPKFVKEYEKLMQKSVDAIKQFASEVRNRSFPDDDHTYH